MTKIDQNKVIWLTGASSGIGEALAYQLNERQAKLILSARRQEELERVKQNCKYPDLVEVYPLDLSQHLLLAGQAEEVWHKFGPIDILINNGGISQRDTALNTSLEVDRRIMEINFFGSIALSKALLPKMIERKRGHHVITSSAVGIISTPFRSAYAASKHALHGFYDALRAEHEKDQIKVTIVCPGFIKTNITLNALKGDGTPQNKMDHAQANGILPEHCARKMIRAIEKDRLEVYIGGAKEVFGIYVKRFIPGLFARMISKMAVT
jgi:short-subunit dehydrogenase